MTDKILPKAWYNILPDLPRPLPPPRDPENAEDFSRVELLLRIFPKEILRQETISNRHVEIPFELREQYRRTGRPTPLCRARRLESFLKTPAKIYYKREDVSPTGSHKTNTALAQAYFAKNEGIETLTTETGAGQWGSALAFACSLYDLKCKVYMVMSSYHQKPYRKTMMALYGAEVYPSPSSLTEIGRKTLTQNPNHPGTLGLAISEAIETALNTDGTRYAIGSVFNAILMHQTVIGLETKSQFETLNVKPDVMVACVGGGSNFAGFTYPFLGEQLQKNSHNMRFIAAVPAEVPKFTKGQYRYDFGDAAKLTPLLKMYTLGFLFTPPPIYAGGLRYHGCAPSLSLLVHEKLVDIYECSQRDAFAAGEVFAQTEGIVPAPETCHAIAAVLREALKAKRSHEIKVIALCLSGHGLLDLANYESILNTADENTT